MSRCVLHVGLSHCAWAKYAGPDIKAILANLSFFSFSTENAICNITFTVHVLHQGGDCEDGGLRWLRNIGACLSGHATSYMVLTLLKPTGYVTHQQFNIQQLYVLPTLYLCVLYLSENKQRLVPLIS